MEFSDSTPREPALELDRSMPDPSKEDLLAIEWAINRNKPIYGSRARALYNSYIRQCQAVVMLEQYLGSASDDIMEEVYRELGSA